MRKRIKGHSKTLKQGNKRRILLVVFIVVENRIFGIVYRCMGGCIDEQTQAGRVRVRVRSPNPNPHLTLNLNPQFLLINLGPPN